LRGDLVRDVMSAPVVTAGPCLALDGAMHLMGDRAIGALPVVDGGHVVAILSQSDIVTALAGGRPA
jgi:acetoin utilization protein AcuB